MHRIPITIIAGFLGSGKTTLINQILKENEDLKIGIVLNEFGDVKLESQFIDKDEEGVVELPNGCVCCVARGDMIETLDKILSQYPYTNYILIESSGLSDPFSLSLTFYNPSLVDRFRLDSIICLVDAENFEYQLDEYDIARKQISDANMVLMTKLKNQSIEKINQLKDLISSLNPKCLILESDEKFKAIDLLDISMVEVTKLSDLEIEQKQRHIHEDFSYYIYKTETPLDFNKFEEAIKRFPKEIIRAKGFINFANAPHKDKKYLLQYVVNRKDYKIAEWDEKNSTAILFIGKNLDTKVIEDILEGTLEYTKSK